MCAACCVKLIEEYQAQYLKDVFIECLFGVIVDSLSSSPSHLAVQEVHLLSDLILVQIPRRYGTLQGKEGLLDLVLSDAKDLRCQLLVLGIFNPELSLVFAILILGDEVFLERGYHLLEGLENLSLVCRGCF